MPVLKALLSPGCHDDYKNNRKAILYIFSSYEQEFLNLSSLGIFSEPEFFSNNETLDHLTDLPKYKTCYAFFGEENLNYAKLVVGNLISWPSEEPTCEYIISTSHGSAGINLSFLFEKLREIENPIKPTLVPPYVR